MSFGPSSARQELFHPAWSRNTYLVPCEMRWGALAMRKNQIQKCSEVKSNMQSAFQFPAGLSSIFCCKDCLQCQARREGFNDSCKQGAASSDQEPSHHLRPESDKVQVDHPRNVEALD